ncbi:MAG: hypothetical protein OEX07_07070 [Gammaproteobacteria bacterium]|nr:hypothetical protein [Gammaproteobacteria bacterium]
MHGSTFAFLIAINFPLNLQSNLHSNLAFASDDRQSLTSLQEQCYAASMIGYDYVINSRVGLPIERALETISVDKNSESVLNTYKYYLEDIVTNAYHWQSEPHTYAVKVMYNCAFNQGVTSSSL